ncbi:ABC transporter substrate-binding protein [Olsenella phocaeensis]|uniref:ABC transporter substrate-binding protein n=1 Tax=Olsenella phocaeensis TaxID=1852385 RepID=UPI003A915D0E
MTSFVTPANLSRRGLNAESTADASSLVLAGCGACTAAPAADTKEKTKVTFCLDYTPNTNHTGIYVAQHEGYFDEEGLEVSIVQPAEDTAETMIGSGQAQLGVSYQDYIANVLSNSPDLPVTAVAAILQHNTSGIMSRKEDAITSAKGMEDHVYATWDMPIEQATIKDVVEADGGDYSKVRMVPYAVNDEIAGLRANMFDTVWVYEGWAVQNAAVQGYDVNYFSFIDMDEVFDFYTPVIAANPEFASKNPDVVKAFLRAVRRGYEYAVKDPDSAADLLCAEVPELDAALVRQSQSYLKDQYVADAASWGVIDKARWARYFQWLNDNGLVANKIDVDAGWTADYLEA